MKVVFERAIVTSHYRKASENGKPARDWLEVTTGKGRCKFTSTEVDLSTLPALVPMKLELDVTPNIWGNSLVLIVDNVSAKAL